MTDRAAGALRRIHWARLVTSLLAVTLLLVGCSSGETPSSEAPIGSKQETLQSCWSDLDCGAWTGGCVQEVSWWPGYCGGTCTPLPCNPDFCGTQFFDGCGGYQDCPCSGNGQCVEAAGSTTPPAPGVLGVCECTPSCAGKSCADSDGCGGTCADELCGENESCQELDGVSWCACQPQTCAEQGVECGTTDNGCNVGVTIDCGGCPGGQACNGGQCVTCDCTGKSCGESDGCGNACLGTCPNGGICEYLDGNYFCVEPPCSCNGKACGADDGCGNSCNGPCAGANDLCVQGSNGYFCQCQPDCTGKNCGDPDGCGAECFGACPVGESCQTLDGDAWCACQPKTCAEQGVECGTTDNGCNVGVTIDCGGCPAGESCNAGVCEPNQTGECNGPFVATNSEHVAAGRAYYVCGGFLCSSRTYYATGTDDNLGTSGSAEIYLWEISTGVFSSNDSSCIDCQTCADLGAECGIVSNNCAEFLDCGGCPGADLCVDHQCTDPCGGTCGDGELCIGSRCVHHCDDGVKNADETFIDCGGSCGPCNCDCGSSECGDTSSCGSSCGTCASGQYCLVQTLDYLSWGTCVDHCDDGYQNYGETGVDCGEVCSRNCPQERDCAGKACGAPDGVGGICESGDCPPPSRPSLSALPTLINDGWRDALLADTDFGQVNNYWVGVRGTTDTLTDSDLDFGCGTANTGSTCGGPYTATNSDHVAAGRATTERRSCGFFCRETVYLAVGSGEELGTSGGIINTLYETDPGVFSTDNSGCGSASQKDAFYRFTLCQTTTVTIDTANSTWDPAIGIFDGGVRNFDATTVLECAPSGTRSITRELEPGDYWVVIRGAGDPPQPFALYVHDDLAEEPRCGLGGEPGVCGQYSLCNEPPRILPRLQAGDEEDENGYDPDYTNGQAGDPPGLAGSDLRTSGGGQQRYLSLAPSGQSGAISFSACDENGQPLSSGDPLAPPGPDDWCPPLDGPCNCPLDRELVDWAAPCSADSDCDATKQERCALVPVELCLEKGSPVSCLESIEHADFLNQRYCAAPSNDPEVLDCRAMDALGCFSGATEVTEEGITYFRCNDPNETACRPVYECPEDPPQTVSQSGIQDNARIETPVRGIVDPPQSFQTLSQVIFEGKPGYCFMNTRTNDGQTMQDGCADEVFFPNPDGTPSTIPVPPEVFSWDSCQQETTVANNPAPFGNMKFGVDVAPNVRKIARIKDLPLGEADLQVDAGIDWGVTATVWENDFTLIGVDAAAKIDRCEIDVHANVTLLNQDIDVIDLLSDLPDDEFPVATAAAAVEACKATIGLPKDVQAALDDKGGLIPADLHMQRMLFDREDSLTGITNRIKKALTDARLAARSFEQIERDPDTGRMTSVIDRGLCYAAVAQFDVGITKADCDLPEGPPIEAINAFIDHYNSELSRLASLLPALADNGAAFGADYMNQLTVEDSLTLFDENVPFEETVLTMTYPVGPLSVVMEIAAGGHYGVFGGLNYGFYPRRLLSVGNPDVDLAHASFAVEPNAGAWVSVFVGAGVGTSFLGAHVGIEGTLELVSAGIPSHAGLVLHRETTPDTRPVSSYWTDSGATDTSNPALFRFRSPTQHWSLEHDVGVDFWAVVLSGKIDLRARIALLLYTLDIQKTMAEWEGFGIPREEARVLVASNGSLVDLDVGAFGIDVPMPVLYRLPAIPDAELPFDPNGEPVPVPQALVSDLPETGSTFASGDMGYQNGCKTAVITPPD